MPPHDEAPWIVEFYRDRRGRKPAEEFLDTLTAVETAEALRLLRLLREYGIQLSMPHARPIGGLWELRPGPNRFFYVAVRGAASLSCTAIANGARPPRSERSKPRSVDWLTY